VSRRDPQRIRQQAQQRIAQIRDRILAVEHLCSGTLIRRMKLCGKPACRCAQDPEARHGPYYEWGYMKAGKLRHRWIPAEKAKRLQAAIWNYRAARRLLRAWEAQTLRIIETE
jgi:hypothetical protein